MDRVMYICIPGVQKKLFFNPGEQEKFPCGLQEGLALKKWYGARPQYPGGLYCHLH